MDFIYLCMYKQTYNFLKFTSRYNLLRNNAYNRFLRKFWAGLPHTTFRNKLVTLSLLGIVLDICTIYTYIIFLDLHILCFCYAGGL